MPIVWQAWKFVLTQFPKNQVFEQRPFGLVFVFKNFSEEKKPICNSVTSLTPLFFCYFFLFCFLLRFWYLRFLSFFSQYPLLKRSQNIGKVMHAQLKLKYAIKIKWGKERKERKKENLEENYNRIQKCIVSISSDFFKSYFVYFRYSFYVW